MLELGVFGGWYFGKDYGEYPSTWFKYAKISTNGFDESLNRFKITAGLTREEWNKKGWIYPEDPLGWFQWYCRYQCITVIRKTCLIYWHLSSSLN